MTDTISALSDEYWDTWMQATPLFATAIGDHRFDDTLGPVRREDWDDFRQRIEAISQRASRLDGLHGEDALTREVLVAVIDNLVKLIGVEVYTAPISPFLGVHSSMPSTMSRAAAQTPDQAAMLLERVRAIPAFMAEIEQRQRLDLAEGVTPTEANVSRVLDQLDATIAAPLDTDVYVTIGAPPDWEGEDEWRADLRHAVAEGIRPALARYRDFLSEVATPVARSDESPGMLHLPDGPERYGRIVEVFTSLGLGPDEVHRVGLEAVARLREEFASVGSDALGTSDPDQIVEQLREDPSLRYDTGEEMLEHARRTIDRAWEAVPPWFGVMPEGPCDVEAVPETLAPSMPSAYYGVGATDGSRPGTYFLNTHLPETRTRFDAEAVAFHEAIPGHHFDRTLAAELQGIPRFRRYATETAHVEGWGLYAERLADEIGLYTSPVDRLGMITSEMWRAVRLVVDTGIHHLGWSRTAAIEYFRSNAPVSIESIESEVDRYIGMPGQALAYMIGQREIFRLRDAAQEAMGPRFSFPGFHDVVLTHGSVPLRVLRSLVDDWTRSG